MGARSSVPSSRATPRKRPPDVRILFTRAFVRISAPKDSAERRIESETARYLILTTPRHGEFYRAITLPAKPDGSQPEKSIECPQIREASQKYGIEFVGPLPDDS